MKSSWKFLGAIFSTVFQDCIESRPGQDQPEEEDLRAGKEVHDGGKVPSDGVEAQDRCEGGEAGAQFNSIKNGPKTAQKRPQK